MVKKLIGLWQCPKFLDKFVNNFNNSHQNNLSMSYYNFFMKSINFHIFFTIILREINIQRLILLSERVIAQVGFSFCLNFVSLFLKNYHQLCIVQDFSVFYFIQKSLNLSASSTKSKIIPKAQFLLSFDCAHFQHTKLQDIYRS